MRRLPERAAVENRFDPPSQPVADDRIADRFGDRDPHAGRGSRLGREQNEERSNLPFAAALDPCEVAAAPERLVAAHRVGSALLLDGEAVTAFFAASSQNLTAVLSAHALEETMDALASTVVRLKGPFHGTGAPSWG